MLEKLKKEPEELEKQKKLLIILQKKTLPYWKNWKKTERLQQEPEKLEKYEKLKKLEK